MRFHLVIVQRAEGYSVSREGVNLTELKVDIHLHIVLKSVMCKVLILCQWTWAQRHVIFTERNTPMHW